ncbi:MAG: hypothetical protein KAJ07_00320 [Planctomycetes bacterium]|nr:hypothetical protein [Planctomycetota bacterium]
MSNKITLEKRKRAAKLASDYRDKNKASLADIALILDCYPWQVSHLVRGIRVSGPIILRALDKLDK